MREYKFLRSRELSELETQVNKFMTDFTKFDPRFEQFKANEDRGWEEYYAVMSKTTHPLRRPQSI